jgi:hypothetical protein
VIFDDLRDRESELVQTALQRKCAVCPSKSGEECVDLSDSRTLFEAVGRYVHLMRADGLPYTPPRKAS